GEDAGRRGFRRPRRVRHAGTRGAAARARAACARATRAYARREPGSCRRGPTRCRSRGPRGSRCGDSEERRPGPWPRDGRRPRWGYRLFGRQDDKGPQARRNRAGGVRPMKRVVTLAAFVSSLAISLPALAQEDTVFLANGGRLRGTVVSEDPVNGVRIKLL